MSQNMIAEEIEKLLRGSPSQQDARNNRHAAEELSKTNPDNEDLQAAYLQILLRTRDVTDMSSRWQNFHKRWPDNKIGLRFAGTALIREDRLQDGIELIENGFDLKHFNETEWCDCAVLLASAGAYERSDEIFCDILATGSTLPRVIISYAKSLKKRGRFKSALHVLDPIRSKLQPGSKAAALLEELEEVAAFQSLHTGADDKDMRIDLMVQLIKAIGEERVSPNFTGLGKSCLMTGQLAAAGAERQLSRLAINLKQMVDGDHFLQVNDKPISQGQALLGGKESRPLKSIDVLVRTLDPAGGYGFFLPDLVRSGVPIEEVEPGNPYSAARSKNPFSDINIAFEAALKNMPASVDYGVQNIYPILKDRQYDSISIWQDGAVLYGAPAALLAGIPKIQLMFRGLPPNLRSYLLKPEYEPIYRALSRVPGISFAANSQVAINEYESWLEFPPGTIKLLPNAVPEISSLDQREDIERWREFADRTKEASFTVGSIARFDHVKRPLDWIKVAASFYKRNPKARFVMVGDGKMREQSENLAKAHQMSDRILFVGHSKDVAFWYQKMDTLLLLSRHEGLPNVLIEAQLSGVPVVSTRAGGAEECFIPGKTGLLLTCLEEVDIPETVAALERVAKSSIGTESAAKTAIAFARDKFSVLNNIRTFLSIW